MENTLRFLLGDGYEAGKENNGGRGSKKSANSADKGGDSEITSFEESEISVMLEFVEEHYGALYGHNTGTEVKAKKEKNVEVICRNSQHSVQVSLK